MPKQLRVRVILNKGRHGVPLEKLSKVTGELQQFLRDLEKDLGVHDEVGWQGINFKDGSLDFIAVKNALIEEPQYRAFNDSARRIIKNEPDDRVSRKTRSQYAKIAAPIDPDEVVFLGIEHSGQKAADAIAADSGFEFHELTKLQAQEIQTSVQARVRAVASIQGVIHSVFIEGDPPHFNLRELSSQDLINCTYKESTYPKLAAALERRKAIVHVIGTSITDTLSRKIEHVEVDEIIVSPLLGRDFLDRFFGCAQGLVDEENIQEHIDNSRHRGN